ncbi:MAG: thiamine phosphate synthase [Alphaproteobacteria bacterium]|nr:thiamine phosphate synthase [Alphaproteobacteria bacterium]
MSAQTLTKLSRRLNHRAQINRPLPNVLLLTDQARLPEPIAAARHLPRGGGIILRNYEDPHRQALGRDLMTLCKIRGLYLLIAGDWQLAWKLGAHGVHLPEWQTMRPPIVCRKPGWIMTAAAHSRPALLRAARLGVHGVLLSPIFPTASHPGASVLGSLQFSRLAVPSSIPVYGLGGITARNARRLNNSGAVGIAAISALVS